MSDITKELATEFLSMVRDTKDFVLSQAPDVLQQLIVWKRVSLSVELLTMLIGLVASIVFFEMGRRAMVKKSADDLLGGEVSTMIFSGFGAFFFMVGAFQTSEKALQVWFAPKVYLLEYLANVVSK